MTAVLMLSLPLSALAEKTNQIVQAGGTLGATADGVSISKTITPFQSGSNVENDFDIELKVNIQEQQLQALYQH